MNVRCRLNSVSAFLAYFLQDSTIRHQGTDRPPIDLLRDTGRSASLRR